jgi:hypothetical protein
MKTFLSSWEAGSRSAEGGDGDESKGEVETQPDLLVPIPRGLFSLSEGDDDGEGRALSHAAVELEAASVRVGDRLGDG